MLSDWWSDQGLLLGPMLALVVFLGVFVGMLVWIFRPGSKQFYQHNAELPLQDEPVRSGQEAIQDYPPAGGTAPSSTQRGKAQERTHGQI